MSLLRDLSKIDDVLASQQEKDKTIVMSQLQNINGNLFRISENMNKLKEEKAVLLKKNGDLTTERDSLKTELERIKAKYGEHLDRLNNEIVYLKAEHKKRIQGFTELLIHLQDIPYSDLKIAKSFSEDK